MTLFRNLLVLLTLRLSTCFFGAVRRPDVQPKNEYAKQGSFQELQMLQRTCYSVSGTRRTIDGIYAELQMGLTVKYFALTTFP